jgi:ParB family chromosome partitioning protein
MAEAMIITLGVDRVHPGHWQPRDRAQITDESVAELAADIKQRGILNPLIGVPMDVDGPIQIELVAGERRWLAAKMAGVNVPVRLVQGTEQELHEMAIVDNLQRENLTPLEEARALKALQDLHGYSQRQLASHLNKSQPWVQQRLALLEAAPKIQEMVNTRVFSLAHARALSGLPEVVQETAAEHLDEQADKGIPMTSRQVQNVGKKIKQFLDPARFEGVEEKLVEPNDRNARIAVRHLLQTLPEERLSKVVQRLLSEKPGSDEARLLSRNTYRPAEVESLARLLVDPESWSGIWSRGEWWTDEIAGATGRTCENCIFVGHEAPASFPSWDPPCLRWKEPERDDISSCRKCILATDAVAIVMYPHWEFDDPACKRLESSYAKYVDDVETCKRLVEKVAKHKAAQAQASEAARNTAQDERLRAFRETCEAADRDPDIDETCPLDVDHFQAQWCARCAFGISGECEFIEAPITKGYGGNRPALYALVQVELEEDNDGNKARTATRVVPRCELFRFPFLPAITPTGWITFSPERRERQKSAMRWLRVLVQSSGDHYDYYQKGLWSALRWLPYDRPRDKHYDLGRMIKYILNEWDGDLGDGKVATLLTTASSERAALARSSYEQIMRLYNPETCVDEEWLVIEWKYIGGPYGKPHWWPNKIEWPFSPPADGDAE